MNIKKISYDSLLSWVDRLIANTTVIGVQAKDDKFQFAPLPKASALRLDYDVTLLPPGRIAFQPSREVLLRFHGTAFESFLEKDPFVLFGVHPYDLVAIKQMDKVFTQDNYDVHYMARREAATIVACDVETVSEHCFAGAVGYAVAREGFDVLLTRIGEQIYLVEAGTPKGLTLTKELNGSRAEKSDLAARQRVWDENTKRLRRYELKMNPNEVPDLLEKSYDHFIWAEKARLCFSCGSCTNVCPTCYCFDVQDDVNWDLKGGTRTRSWDGCQLARFATVAGGHNFRKDRADRYRHRYYRKGSYIAAKVGQLACVGCGRCISACVSKIANPPEVFNTLLETKQ